MTTHIFRRFILPVQPTIAFAAWRRSMATVVEIKNSRQAGAVVGTARTPADTKRIGQKLAEQKRNRRFLFFGLSVTGVGACVFFLLNAFEENMMYYLSPTQLLQRDPPMPFSKTFRLGGLVVHGSLSKEDITTKFVVTDLSNEIEVRFDGALPGMFKEGTSVIAEGRIQPDGVFIAKEVLAKHDENYMPKDIAEQVNMNKLRNQQAEHAVA